MLLAKGLVSSAQVGAHDRSVPSKSDARASLPRSVAQSGQQARVLEQKLDECSSLLNEPLSCWEGLVREQDLSVHRKFLPNNPAVILRAEVKIRGARAQQIFDAIYESAQRVSWDKILKDYHTFEESATHQKVYYYVESGVPFVDDRDFVEMRGFRRDYPQKGTTIQASFSVEHERYPERKDRVRALTYLAGYEIREVDGLHVLKILISTDIRGNIPVQLVNTMAGSQLKKWVGQLLGALAASRK